jgi:hypothetical protein
MPDSFGKRQRDQVKARKAAARDERRVARTKRRKDGSPVPWADGDYSVGPPDPSIPGGAPEDGEPLARETG